MSPKEQQEDRENIAKLSSVRNAHLSVASGDTPATSPEIQANPSGPTPVEEPLAIISDIHGNYEALSEVMNEIRKRNIKNICCLGDVIGYGPNPRECLDTVIENCQFTIMGNHDFAIFFEPFNFNTAAENAAYWTRNQFETDPDRARRNRRWRYLGNMQTRAVNKRFLAVHGSPRRPINEYIFPDDIYSATQKISMIFDRITHLCFVGHTHVPGVFVVQPDFYSPDDLKYRYDITEEKAIINVGSVGQPRDHDPRASFAILHSDHVEFVRIAYDVNTTVEKVRSIDALDNFLGQRLLEGT
ncbi:MAG TPA: metallophosphoesterase family protein [Phycisphaerae bacterium]|nr:metallophosphoesterase family protein [Phycisphaerae bacterium]